MNLEQQLRAALVVCEPGPAPLAAVMAQLSRPARARPGRGSGGRKPVLFIGSVLTLAAAAGMLVMQAGWFPAQKPALLPAGVAANESLEEPATAVQADIDPVEQPAADVPEVPGAVPAQQVQPGVVYFTVFVQPLKLDTSNRTVESRVREYFNALLEELKAVPGLVLVTSDVAAVKPASFRITVSGGDSRNSEYLQGVTMWQVMVQAEVWRDNEYREDPRGGGAAGGTMNPGACQQGEGQPRCGPAGSAVMAVARLVNLFPSSPALDALRTRNREQARLRGADSVKMTADLAAPPGAAAAMDDKVIRAMLDRIAAVQEPGPRAALWLVLRGQKHPERLPLLLKALREETADVVRKEVITQLALEFADDPSVRLALGSVAAIEPVALSRHVAQRAVAGDASWRDYVLATVRDTSLPTAQRLDPLNWMMEAGQRNPGVNATFNDLLLALLDGDGPRVLADLLASKQNQSAGVFDILDNLGSVGIMARLVAVDHPAVPDLLVAYFDASPSALALQMLGQRRNSPRVQMKLEAIVADSADPKLRQQAASFLRRELPAKP